MERWGMANEEAKPPHHYSMIFNYLFGKAVQDIWNKDKDKFKHHLVTIAAVAYNCHRQIEKEGTDVNYWFTAEANLNDKKNNHEQNKN